LASLESQGSFKALNGVLFVDPISVTMSPLLGLLSSLLALQNVRNSPQTQSQTITKLPAVHMHNGAPLDRSRRQAIIASVASFGVGMWLPLPGHASEVRAPIECLLPATRVKLYVDEMVSLCTALLVSTGSRNGLNASDLDTFEKRLLNPPVFIKTDEASIAQTYRKIKTQNAWNKARRSEREQRGAELGIDYTTPYDKINTAIQEWGDQRQFQILRKRQLQLDRESPMRAALNAYTNNLVFGDGYQLNAQDEEKKNLVRNDALPNVNAVVVSDLDLRDLIRNQILQNMDDTRAELKYQMQQPNLEAQEVLNYLNEAQISCDKWFRLIPDQDVKNAISIVSSEAKDI
jgi:hypothetical protein